MGIFSKLAQQIFASADENGNARAISEQEVGVWGTELERLVSLFVSGGGIIYPSKATLDADLTKAANSMAWVLGDPVAANNGIYGKVGAANAGSWTRRGDLPFSFIIASDVGAGTPNAIQATTSIPVSGSALIWMNVADTNTGSPVFVSFNGGSPLAIKNNTGTDISAGGLQSGMIVLGIVSGSTFRLLSDQASAALIAQAQAVLDEFRTIYLGAFAVAPTTDLEGNPLQAGAQYFNTASGTIFTWNGSAWITNADLAVYVPPNLTGSVQAPPIIKANGYEWSIFAFNGGETERSKSGTNTDDFRQVFETALSTGEKVRAPKWDLPVRSYSASDRVIPVTVDAPVDIEFAVGARIVISTELDGLVGGLFSLQASSSPSMTSRTPFSWRGGGFDVSGVSQQTATGLTLLDIYKYSGYSIRDVSFYAGISTPSGDNIGYGRCDAAIVTHNCFGGVIDNCDFVGFVDQGVYLSGNNDGGAYDLIGEAEVVQNSRFLRCVNGINMKRDHLGSHAKDNYFYECVNGILASPADSSLTNQGETAVIIGNRFKKMQGRPIYLETGKDYIVQSNIIVDFGKHVSDGATFTTAAAGNRIGGIDLRGVSFAIVSGNQIRMDAWQGGTAAANREPVGIQIQSSLDGTGSDANVVRGNSIYKVHRTMLEAAGSTNNRWVDNPTTAPTTGTALSHSMLGTGSVFIGAMQKSSATTDPGVLVAAGGQVDITITATGVALGDVICDIAVSRDSEGLEITPRISAADTIKVRLENQTGADVDLATTMFTVWWRKA
jgi:hypothetical protein